MKSSSRISSVSSREDSVSDEDEELLDVVPDSIDNIILDKNLAKEKITKEIKTEQKKAEANIDIISHRTEQFRNTLNIIKSEHSGTQRTQFKEVEY